MTPKYPRVSGRMIEDAVALRAAISDMNHFMAKAKEEPEVFDNHNCVWAIASEIERLATCLRADAMAVVEAAGALQSATR